MSLLVTPAMDGVDMENQATIPFSALRQGGPDSMQLWNMVMRVIIAPLHRKWCEEQKGIILEPSKRQYTHLIWVDGITLLARRDSYLQAMARELTTELHRWGLQWKPQSLSCLAWGGEEAEPFSLGEGLDVPAREELNILGVTVKEKDATEHNIAKRSCSALGSIYAMRETWQNKYIPHQLKLQNYFTDHLPIFLYGSEAWVVSKETLKAIDSFHKKALRIVTNAKWNPDKGPYEDFLRYTTRWAEKLFDEYHVHPTALYLKRVLQNMCARVS